MVRNDTAYPVQWDQAYQDSLLDMGKRRDGGDQCQQVVLSGLLDLCMPVTCSTGVMTWACWKPFVSVSLHTW